MLIENRLARAVSLWRDCGNQARKIVKWGFARAFFQLVHFGKTHIPRGTPLPHPSESLDWRGFRRVVLQNLERLGVKGQNIDFEGLEGSLATSICAAFALAIICS